MALIVVILGDGSSASASSLPQGQSQNASNVVGKASFTKAQILPGTFAIVIDQLTSDAVNDQGFTSQAFKGCQQVVKTLGTGYTCKLIFRTPDQAVYDDDDRLTQYLLDAITSDPNVRHVTLMSFRYKDVMFKLAKALPQLFFAIIDSAISEPFPPNCQGVTFAEDEAGFLAGVVAGAITNTSTVAVIGGIPLEPVQRLVYGFLKGVKFNNPDVTVLGTFVNDPTFSNKALGIAAANLGNPSKEFVSQKADVVFGAGGSMGSAGILRAAQLGAWAIGVDVDESTTTFSNKTDSSSNLIFTSALKRVDKAMANILNELLNRGFQPGNRVMDLQSDSLGLAECSSQQACDLKPKKVFVQESDPTNPSCSSVQAIPIGDLISRMTGKVKVHAISTGVQGGMAQTALASSNGTFSKIQYFGFAPQGLQAHSQTVITDNTFLFYGGQLPNGSVSNTLYSFALDGSTWTPIVTTTPVVPPRLIYHSAAFRASVQELVVYGGQSETAGLAQGDSSVNQDIWRFKWTSKEWVKGGARNEGPGYRTKQAYAVLQDSLYVWGGQDENFSVKDDFWQLDLPSLSWTKIALQPNSPRPEARFSATLTAHNGTLYLYGGNDGNNDGSTLWTFVPDPLTAGLGKWAKVIADDSDRFDGTPIQSPIPLSSHVGISLDERRILFVGGLSGTVAQTESRIYNAGTKRWEVDTKLNLPDGLQGMTAVAVRQSDMEGACNFPNSPFQVCKPINQTTVLIYGGSKRVKGVVSDLLIVAPAAEIPPRALRYVPDLILAIGHVAAAIGILLSIIAIVATVILRHNMAFKTASPIFLSLYAIGSIMACVGIIFYNLPVDPLKCQIGVWFFSEGCMLLFSAMVVKNWRIYYIFYKSMTMRNASLIKNHFLLSIVALLVFINTIVLIIFTIFSPFKMSTVVIELDQWPICGSANIDKWLWLLIAPTMCVLLYGLYISFGTRNVTSKYKESSQINLSIYVTAISLVVLVPLTLTLKAPPTLHIINSLLVCLTLYTVIGTHFFTKIFQAFVRDEDPLKFHSENMSGISEEQFCCRVCMQPLKGESVKPTSGRRSDVRSPVTSRPSHQPLSPPPTATPYNHHQDQQPQRKRSRLYDEDATTTPNIQTRRPSHDTYQTSTSPTLMTPSSGTRTLNNTPVKPSSLDRYGSATPAGGRYNRVELDTIQDEEEGGKGGVNAPLMPPQSVAGKMGSWNVLTEDGVEV
ncbi:hypothetical protein HDU97_007264 [Phlyctochytrium planicorne]|nr:hypothetical protein HDU97_007264 [Phlyctochytrium planicorne]